MTRLPLALAVWIAWELASRVPTSRQRDIARGLTALLVSCLARALRPPQWADDMLFASWYAITGATVVRALLAPPRRSLWLLVPTFLAFAALLGPESTYWPALTLQIGAVGLYLAKRTVPGQVETVGLLLAASSLADVAGPWLCGRPHDDWWIGRYTSVVTWLAVVGWEARCLIRARGSVV